VILPDINLLMYAHNSSAPYHGKARNWWAEHLNASLPVAVPWIVSSGFIRLVTHPRVLESPLPATRAADIVAEWLERPNVLVIEPGKAFPSLFFGYLKDLGTGGNLTTDAYLAALAVEHQAELHSNDADFHRFRGLRWSNPLANG